MPSIASAAAWTQQAAGVARGLFDLPRPGLLLGAGEGDLGFLGAAGAAFSIPAGLDGDGVLSLSDLCRNLHLSLLVHFPFFQYMQTLLVRLRRWGSVLVKELAVGTSSALSLQKVATNSLGASGSSLGFSGT